MGAKHSGIDTGVLQDTIGEIATVHQLGVQIGLVIGAGNIFRGISLASSGLDRVTGDYMGMLATIMNALAMKDALNHIGITTQIASAIEIPGIAPAYNRQETIEALKNGHIIIFAGGTGNPLFTTDTTACLRGIEINADLILKATKVDGVYSDDPVKNPEAERYTTLSYQEVLQKKLKIMDLTAICLMQEHSAQLRVFNMNQAGALKNLVEGKDEGTLVA